MNLVFAIDNYASPEDTQALYLNQSLLDSEIKSILFDSKRQSIYDVFDIHQPTHCVTHGYKINKELIHYLENNDNNIDLLINIQNMDKDHVLQMSEMLNQKNIKCSFFFLNCDKDEVPKINKRNIITICSAADSNLLKQKPSIEYKIDKGIIVYNKFQTKEYEGSYHNISFLDSLKDSVDIVLPEISLAPLYKFYNEIIFRDFTGYIPQAFFDAIMMGAKVYFDIDDKEKSEKFDNLISKILKITSSLDYNCKDKLLNFSEVKNFIMNKHTNVNRTSSLLSNIKRD